MDPRIHRRRVLQLTSSGVLAWSFGPLLAGCSRRGHPDRGAQAEELEGAWQLARSDRRPLLVLLANPNFPAGRGMQWSAYFDLASDQALAGLASCELAFAVPDQVRAALPWVSIEETNLPQAVLVEPDGRTTAFVPAVRPEPTWHELTQTADPEPLRAWIGQFESAVHAVLASSRSLSALGSPSNVRDAAASMRERMRESAPAGGKWAKSFGGCGSIEFEDGTELAQDRAVACGIAHQPENARRFLWLYCERKS